MEELDGIAGVAGESALFRGMAIAATADALAFCEAKVHAFQAGEAILREGAAAAGLGVILTGRAAVYKSAGGARVLMSVLNAADLTGAAGIYGKNTHAVTEVDALTRCEVLFIEESKLKALMRRDFKIAENFMAYLTERIRFLTGRIESIASSDAAEKLLVFIKKNAKQGVLTLTQSYSALADALAISRASLYRAMDSLEKGGHISKKDKTIILLEERK